MTRTIDPIVTTEWLENRLREGDGTRPPAGLIVLDIRFEEEYAAAHVPGSISVPFGLNSAWAVSDDVLILELPPDEDLFKAIGEAGMTAESQVVVVGRPVEPPNPPYQLADAARVAVTLIYAGIENVAVLAGGHAKWESEGLPVSVDVPAIAPVPYQASPDRCWWVTTDYVKDHMGECALIDARDPDDYFGASTDPFADMNGHIPTARSLPAVWVWEKDGTYRPDDVIEEMAAGVIGDDRDQEIVLYCGAGGYASTWWFLLTQLLGYRDVKIYDGSMEAWADGGSAVERYTWE
jgi:thiosulfate/3-mercaptopyruvate sulfurtransferase